ncbi:MAG: hypothetical protein KatS3mg062_0335 [Tepidiforma sp.]|nr:MAG: hypothetical protein KatS3mg062_0335 [Tepidiforma sp.]
MTPAAKRRYHSPQREAQAAATRRAILEAAERLFEQRGFAAVSMAAIAREAGVSLASVYVYFAGKAAIVSAMAEAIVASEDLSVEQVERAQDGRQALEIGASIMRRLNERSWVVADILRTAHATDPEIAKTWALWQARHLNAMKRAVGALARLDALRRDLSIAEAADILYAAAGTEVFRLLVRDRGWPPERYQSWLFSFACRELLQPESG